jgi:hypothetical protein
MILLTPNRKVDTSYEQLGWFRVYDLTNHRPFGFVISRPGYGGRRQGVGTLRCS